MFPENWHFNSRFVLKTTKTPVQCLFSLLRFFDELFDVINDGLFLTLQNNPAIIMFFVLFEKAKWKSTLDKKS